MSAWLVRHMDVCIITLLENTFFGSNLILSKNEPFSNGSNVVPRLLTFFFRDDKGRGMETN